MKNFTNAIKLSTAIMGISALLASDAMASAKRAAEDDVAPTAKRVCRGVEFTGGVAPTPQEIASMGGAAHAARVSEEAKKHNANNPLFALPIEVLTIICGYLDENGLLAAVETSIFFKYIAGDNQLWDRAFGERLFKPSRRVLAGTPLIPSFVKQLSLRGVLTGEDDVSESDDDASESEDDAVVQYSAYDLFRALKENKTLTTLDLRDNDINDDQIDRLCYAMEGNTTLKTVSFENNEQTDYGDFLLHELALKKGMAITLKDGSNAAAMTELDMNSLTAHHGSSEFDVDRDKSAEEVYDCFASLMQRLKTNTSITYLDIGGLSFIQVGDADAEDVKKVIGMLEKNKTIQYLCMCAWNIKDETAEDLVDFFIKHPSLTELDISNNRLTTDECKEELDELELPEGKILTVYIDSD